MLFVAAILLTTVNYAQQVNLANRALLFTTQLNGVPLDRLSIAHTAWLGSKIFRAKVVDNGTGEIYVVSLDSSGALATDQEVKDAITASLEKGFIGKVQESLRAKVDASPLGTSSINIWVKTPEIPLAAWHSGLEQGRRQQVLTEAAAFRRQAETPVLNFLHSVGIKEREASQYAPVIACEIPDAVLAQLEELPEVTRIYDDGIAGAALNTSIPTIKAQKVWNQGITGSGVTVAIVEAQVGGVNAIVSNNPFLGAMTYYDTMHTQASHHATEVAGVIGSIDTTYRGVSYGVPRPLLNGNPSDPSYNGVDDATGWAALQAASVINQSYRSNVPNGLIGTMGQYDDYIVGAYLCTIAVCAGNSDPDSGFSYRVDDPAVAYNVIAVGAFDHRSDSDWSNDVMTGYSAYINPISPHNDREKPEVAAPGNVNSTFEVSPWVPSPIQGTSFSGPHVAGTAALLMQAKPSLKTAPEEVKAVVMASAVHNIEGATRLSDLDGAGGLQAKAAYDAVVSGSSSYFRDSTIGSCRTVTFSATSGQVIRFAICWLSQIIGGNDRVQDLDLVLKNPSGTVVATSASFDNNFEIVEVTAASTGT